MKLKNFISYLTEILFIMIISLVVFQPAKINGGVIVDEEKEIKLSAPTLVSKTSFEEVLVKRRSIRNFSSKPLSLKELSQLLWSAQGITEKTLGLRTAPSAGALYPLEIYAVVGNVEEVEAGVYKYKPQNHSLIKIQVGDKRIDIYNSALKQESIKQSAVCFVITAVYGRTSWKYGNRAERYVHMEVGHAGQNILLQATALNLGAVPIGAFYDAQVKSVLRLPKEEEPLYIIPVGKK